MASKYRKFSIVFHNVRDDFKEVASQYFSTSKRVVLALEPYKDTTSPGKHLHVFVEYNNPLSWSSMKSKCENLSKQYVVEVPEGTEGSIGRVQVDQMRGRFNDAVAYLVAPNKDKIVDPEGIVQLAGLGKHQRKCVRCSMVFDLNSSDHQHDYMDSKSGLCFKCHLKTEWLDRKSITEAEYQFKLQNYFLHKYKCQLFPGNPVQPDMFAKALAVLLDPLITP